MKGTIMLQFLKSDLMHYFTGGFAMGAVALFFAQPLEARVEIVQDIAHTAAKVQNLV